MFPLKVLYKTHIIGAFARESVMQPLAMSKWTGPSIFQKLSLFLSSGIDVVSSPAILFFDYFNLFYKYKRGS
jgi:hypothetical protein